MVSRVSYNNLLFDHNGMTYPGSSVSDDFVNAKKICCVNVLQRVDVAKELKWKVLSLRRL